MSAFLGNAQTMTQIELEQALDDLAARWRKDPYLSNEYADGVRYSELQEALKARFGVSKRIEAIGNPTNYQVV